MQLRPGLRFSPLVPARVDFNPARACSPDRRRIDIFTVWNGLNKISVRNRFRPRDFGQCEKASRQTHSWNEIWNVPFYSIDWLIVCLFVCLSDLSHLGNSDNSHKGKNTKLATQSLSYKYWFNVYDYELHKSRNCDSVTRWQYLF